MAIIDRFKKLFSTGDVPNNTSREITPVRPHRAMRFGSLYTEERGRHAIIRRCREMYNDDPRVEETIRMLARDATRSGFTLTVSAGPGDEAAERAQAVADAAVNRLRLRQRIGDWTRLGARDGDLFLEPGISAAGEIVEVTRKPTLKMVRLSDEFDRFADPTKAFAYADTDMAAAGLVNDKAIFFPQFLMVHARWDHDSESRYGTPLYASSRGAWRKLTDGEEDLAVRRRVRSGIKYVHNLPGAKPHEIEEYRAINEEALGNAFQVITDFYNNVTGGGIDVLDGDPHLSDIADIAHHLQTWSSGSAVPLELLAYGENLNRDVLEDKKRQYDETLEQTRVWVADQIIAPIIEREWLLHDILPEELEYNIGWPSRKIVSPTDLAALVSAVNEMRAKGWSLDAIWSLVEPYVPDEITKETLFDELTPPAPVAPSFPPTESPTAEAIGAVNRLLGRLEAADLMEGSDAE